MRGIYRLLATAAALTTAVTLAACSSGSGSIGSGSTAQPKGAKEHGGTVTVAWPATPNLIFPLPPATNTDGFNVNLDNPMWPVLVYAGDGSQSVVNPQESLFTSMAWSDGDKTVTIDLKHWNWSDGTPVTSRDFTFVYNLLRYNLPNWYYYTPGLFPADVASVATPDAHTVVLHLTRSYNPSFYEDDVLTFVPLLPQHAWDKTSAGGKVGNYDETKAGAKAVYNFLQKQGSQTSTFATNPLWKVVDGPWTLSSFQSNGTYSYVPNKHYSGPDKPVLSKVVNEAFTTDTAVLNALRSGGSLDVGSLPLNDIRQSGVLKSEGYSLATLHVPGVAAITPNFYNAQVGPVLRQLYIRQAMEDLINRPQIVAKVYGGYADPGNGPVPVQATPPWVSPLERAGGPYPYSPSTAIALLKAHGWKVVPNGASTCQRAGSGPSDCGAGISPGQALSFQLIYSSGMTSMDEQEAAIQSSEAQAGIKISLKSEPFNTLVGTVGVCTAAKHPASTCGWQLTDAGYDPYELYPNGTGFFNTGAFNNQGGYSSAEMNNLIDATEYGPSKQAFFTYEDYAARQLPWLWLPDADFIQVYKSNLANYAPLNPFSGGLNPEDWYYTK
ncbi:MAG TPA: peptide ABC transporter substrate-binding protein [Streptosporangiaceae bacterium]|jgi:peptide/nickel transport system substrate-binding protein|nr:peptide ABC transporter substrate-binding protein [Streptosporangiaceae bacterium]